MAKLTPEQRDGLIRYANMWDYTRNVSIYGLTDYMEEHGYDPIGASDLLENASRWLQKKAIEDPNIQDYTIEELYNEWRATLQ